MSSTDDNEGGFAKKPDKETFSLKTVAEFVADVPISTGALELHNLKSYLCNEYTEKHTKGFSDDDLKLLLRFELLRQDSVKDIKPLPLQSIYEEILKRESQNEADRKAGKKEMTYKLSPSEYLEVNCNVSDAKSGTTTKKVVEVFPFNGSAYEDRGYSVRDVLEMLKQETMMTVLKDFNNSQGKLLETLRQKKKAEEEAIRKEPPNLDKKDIEELAQQETGITPRSLVRFAQQVLSLAKTKVITILPENMTFPEESPALVIEGTEYALKNNPHLLHENLEAEMDFLKTLAADSNTSLEITITPVSSGGRLSRASMRIEGSALTNPVFLDSMLEMIHGMNDELKKSSHGRY